MKALVVGGSGLLGDALVRILGRGGIETLATYHTRAVPGAERLDIRDAREVEKRLTAARPEVVFLAVAPPGDEGGRPGTSEIEAVFVDGARHVAQAATRCGARLVYYSSDAVFDGTAGPYGEDDAVAPRDAWGRALVAGEAIVRAAGAEHLVVRTCELFGWARASRNLAIQVWERLEAGQTLRVAADHWTNPTLVEYLAEVSLRLVQAGAKGVCHVAGKDWQPRAQTAQALARAMGLDSGLIVAVPASELGPAPPGPLKGGLRIDRLEGLLGTEPLDLGESLKRFRRDWRADTHTTVERRTGGDEAAQLKTEILDRVRRYYHLVHEPPPFVPFQSRLQYAGRVFGPEEMVNLVDSSLDFWLTMGPYSELFEQKMKRYFGARDFAMVTSGSTANLTAILTMMSAQLPRPLRPGDEVITPAVTFPTTLAPLVHHGLVPVFVDCEIGTYNVNPRLLEGAISDRTRALMLPHTLGVPLDMDVVMDLVKRHGLYLIEDCCDALGATFRGRRVGTFGDLATLSFFPAHHITTGEGGGVIVNRPELGRIVRSVRDWGRDCWCAPGESNTCGKRFGWQLGALPAGYDHKFIYSNVSYNLKPTDMQAAIGVAQADRIEHFIARRRENFERLYRALEPYQDRLVLPTRDPRSEPSWFGFTITVKEGVSRRELVQWLEGAKIETREIFGGNILKQPGYQRVPHRIHGTLEQTDRVMRDTFFIGVYPGMTEEMIEFIAERFKGFFARR